MPIFDNSTHQDMIPASDKTIELEKSTSLLAPSTFFISLFFCLSSINMILLNKAVVIMFPFSAVILIFQNAVTVLLLKFTHTDLVFNPKTALTWIPCMLLFCTNTYSSLQALTYISVPTFTVFRNIQPLLSSVLDLVVRHESISFPSIVLLCVILFGACLYAYNDLEYNYTGYIWSIVHIISMSFYSVSVKLSFKHLKLKPHEMSWYNNIMSLGVLYAIVCYGVKTETQTSTKHIKTAMIQCSADWKCWSVVASSCVGGYFVSVTGFRAQEALTPTSWLTLNNLSKIPALIIACLLWTVNFNMLEVIGLAISLTGGYLYAMEKQGLLTWQRADEME